MLRDEREVIETRRLFRVRVHSDVLGVF